MSVVLRGHSVRGESRIQRNVSEEVATAATKRAGKRKIGTYIYALGARRCR